MSAVPDHILHRGAVNKAADKAADAVLEIIKLMEESEFPVIHVDADKPTGEE